MSTGTSRKTEKNDKKKYKGIVKRCTLIKMKQEKCRRKELNVSKRKDQHFTDDGRGVNLVLQARAQMSEHKVNGTGTQLQAR